MDEMEQAHHELERIQGIITRHEGHMVAVRGWLLVILSGLLAGYYTGNIEMSALRLQGALLVITVLFLLADLRYLNLVEALVERATAVEWKIRQARQSHGHPTAGWYDGPRVSEACLAGASRLLPQKGMTLTLNLAFYVVVGMIVILITVFLPARHEAASTSPPAAASK